MTSLAKQLQRLAVPHTQAVLGDDRWKASLLFDPKEAASIDTETYHALGQNGLEELESIDRIFLEFADSLFGDSAVTFQRSVQTKEVNEMLDTRIRKFLIHLSPYCLLKPAHKTLEWLIHRYQIHFYNVDDLLMCFLPYHESKIFIRVLQLLKFDNKIASKWDWLQPLQKAGVHLSRLTLVNHCRTNPAFLSFISNMIPATIKVHQESGIEAPKCRVLFSFYATTIISVIDTGPVKEEFVSIILPHLSRGMKSGLAEYKASSYMILAQLLHSTKLKSDILKTLQNILTKSLGPDLMGEGLACLLLMFQTQDMTATRIPKRSFKNLCQHFSIIDTLAQLAHQFDVSEFLSCFLNKLVPAAFKLAVGLASSGVSGASSSSESDRGSQQYMSMLHRLLQNVKLTDSIAEQVALEFLEAYIQQSSKYVEEEVDELLKESLQGIVRQLEGRYSSAVDNAVKKMMSQTKSKKDRELIQSFLNIYVLSVPHQLVADTSTSLVLSLNHRLAAVRKSAVTTLIQNRDDVEDEEFFQHSVEARLNDDDSHVVAAVLELGNELWTILQDDMKTASLLIAHIFRGIQHPKSDWKTVASLGAQILGEYKGENHSAILASILGLLFMTKAKKFHLDLIQSLLQSKMAATSYILKKVATEWKKMKVKTDKVNLGKINSSLCECFGRALIELEEIQGIELVKSWILKANSVPAISLLLITLDNVVTMSTCSQTKLKYGSLQVQLILNSIAQEKEITVDDHDIDHMTGDWSILIGQKKGTLEEGLLPFSFCSKVIYTLVDVLQIPPQMKELAYWQYKGDHSCEDEFLRLYTTVYSLLLEKTCDTDQSADIFRRMIILFEQKFPDTLSYMKFLSLLWTQHTNNFAEELELSAVWQARSLKLGLATARSLQVEDIKIVLDNVSVIVSMLVVCTSEHAPIRGIIVEIASEFYRKIKEDNCIFTPLLKKMVHCGEEICADPTFIQQLIASFFKHTAMECDSSPQKSPRKKDRRKSIGQGQVDPKRECLLAMIGQIDSQSTPLYVQKQLLHIFALLNNKEVLTALLPLMDRLLSLDHDSMSEMATDCLSSLILRFTVETKDVLQAGSPGLDVFLRVLKTQGNCVLQKQAVEQLTKEMYSDIEPSSQQKILSCLFLLCLDTRNLEVANAIRRCLKHLPLDGGHIETELRSCLQSQTASTVREAKKLKQTEDSASSQKEAEYNSRDWQRVTIVLESVQNKKKILNYTVLVPVSFQLIAKILESDNHSEAEYMKQLILSVLYNICGRMQKEMEDTKDVVVPERQFNMELIVNCIRSSENPQTHHQALLVLTSAAKIYPEHLLHNMMSVFTFMGANIMRQDDAYSFHIISRILETVIPALITACEQRKRVPKGITNDLDDIITMVIQVFVDAYSHIPEHRRPLLFTKLLEVIGEENYLWRMLLLMMELIVTKGTLKAELIADSQEGDPGIRDVEFCLSLCSQVSVSVQLISARKIIEYQLSFPDDKEDECLAQLNNVDARDRNIFKRYLFSHRPIHHLICQDSEEPQKRKSTPQTLSKLMKEDAAIFNVTTHSAKQLRHFKYATVHLLISLFASKDFLAQLSENEDETMMREFQSLLETLLQYITHVTSVMNTSADKPTAKFWRALQHKVHDLLDKLVSLLQYASFIDVISGLVSHDLPSIQRKAIELLNTKLQQQKDIGEDDGSELLPLVSQLEKLIKTETKGKGISEEGSINSQAAFISLKLLCRHIGQQYTEDFVKVLKTAVGVFTSRHGNLQVSSCALLCIAEICNTLKVHVIQHLSSFMPALLKTMKNHDKLLQNELYILSVVKTVNKVVENLSHFLSPYLQDIILHTCILSSQADDVLQKPQVQLRLKTIRSTLSTALPTRVLLPTVNTCFVKLVEDNKGAITCLLSLFGDHIGHIGREDLLSHMTQLQSFFMTCLNIRIDYPEEETFVIYQLEGVTIETIITMVMKLSEATFKPFLYKLFDWATSDDEYRDRILVFYRLAESLAEKLRSLFTLFAGHIISHAANMLENNNISKTNEKFFSADKKRNKSCQLLEYILDCLYKTFLYDTESFVNKERFDIIMQPLVDQIENVQGSEKYKERVEQHLVRCIVQFTVASQDDSLWRSINYQICLKTRSSEPEVKEAALQVLDELHKRLGEDYMPMLPDTVPFLAELMEDDSEEVEKKCHAVIREMEKTLGEPLQKYF